VDRGQAEAREERGGEARRRRIVLVLGSAVLAALVLGLAEVVRQLLGASGLLAGPAGVARFAVFNLSLYAVAGMTVGLLELLVLVALPTRLDPRRLAPTLREWWSGQHSAGEAITGGLLGGLFGLGLFGLVAFRAGLYFMENFADHSLASAALSVLLLGGLAVCALAGLLCSRLASAALRRIKIRWPALVAPRVLVLVLGLLVAAAVAVLVVAHGHRLAGADLSPLFFLLAFVTLHLLIAVVLAPVSVERLVRLAPVRWGWPVALLAALLGMSYTLFNLGDHPQLKYLTAERTVGTRELVRAFQSALDRDGDGYAALLGGGDCDDSDPGVNPGAAEVPNNGVDEDCSGEDLRIASFGEEEPADGVLPEELVPPLGMHGRMPPPAAVAQADKNAVQLPERPDLLLLSIDALRGDRLGVAGYPRPLTPNLDRLARRGAYYPRAYSQASATAESFSSMLTSKYPSEVDWGGKTFVPLQPSNVTLAEALLAAGYSTAGIVTHSYFLPEYGYGQGFEHWDTSQISRVNSIAFGQTTSPQLTDRAIAYLDRTAGDPRPRLLWVHYFDPHDHYVFHEGAMKFGTRPIDRYDHEIRFTDEHIGRLLDHVASTPRGQNTIIVVWGDHGEAFGEHGYTLHGRHLYDDQIHVPLILAGPGIRPTEVEHPVGLIDVAPTLVLLAEAHPPVDFRGKDLRRYLEPGYRADDVVFSEFLGTRRRGPKKAMITGSWKLIYDLRERLYFLHDLKEDPGERRNLYALETMRARELRRTLTRWMSTQLKTRWALAD